MVVIIVKHAYFFLQVRYLRDFAERLELIVQFQNEITEITRDQNGTGTFQLKNQNGTSYTCRVVVVRYVWEYLYIPANWDIISDGKLRSVLAEEVLRVKPEVLAQLNERLNHFFW